MDVTTLIIGYGNTLRGDDGVGYRAAEQVEAWNLPGVRAIACHQLTPELAADMAECDRVIFVDATLPGTHTAVSVQSLQPDPTPLETHFSTPVGVLQMAQQLFNHCPEAYQVLIPTHSMEFTESLSPLTQTALKTALRAIRILCESAETLQANR
jgi:hydrogenase maturation protease